MPTVDVYTSQLDAAASPAGTWLLPAYDPAGEGPEDPLTGLPVPAGAGYALTLAQLGTFLLADTPTLADLDDYQPVSPILTDLAGQDMLPDTGFYVNGAFAFAPFTLTSLGRTLAGSATAAAARGAIGLGTAVTRETPAGVVNGSNVTFTLAHAPLAGSETVTLNGLAQEPGAGSDYTISGAVVTFAAAPASGDRIRVSYSY